MNNAAELRPLHAAVAEFRRWFAIGCILAILGGITLWLAYKISPQLWLLRDTVACATWALVFAGEGWVQFQSLSRRCSWAFGAGIMCAVLNYLGSQYEGGALTKWWEFEAWESLFLFIPATIEFVTARGFRKRPWVWLIATPAIYCGVRAGFELSLPYIPELIQLFEQHITLTTKIPAGLAIGTTFLAIVLFLRAIVGSFVAARKTM